jgi:hypothetical protein
MKKFAFTVVCLLLFSSCREEIVPPGNPAGNVNSPVREIFSNSYSFIINADDITYNLYDNVKFDNNRAQVYISVIDHTSGYVDITLMGKSKNIIFKTRAESDIQGEYSRISTEIPESVNLTFNGFTGKLKLTVTRY